MKVPSILFECRLIVDGSRSSAVFFLSLPSPLISVFTCSVYFYFYVCHFSPLCLNVTHLIYPVVSIEALGHVDKNWFHNLSLKTRISGCKGLKRTPRCVAPNDSALYDDDGLSGTPRGDDSTQIHDPKISTPIIGVPLFSPAHPQGAVCGVESGARWKRVNPGTNVTCQQTSSGCCGWSAALF